ncbi:MAG: alpha/beta fold hydrolase [Burkholderiales bacterium]|nr:alpha/beta fold hydrolase [Burkholderiales bacterium]
MLGLGAAFSPLAGAATSEGSAGSVPGARSRWFTTSDGVRLHYVEAGAPSAGSGAATVVFVPGWTMPAWIWAAQIEQLAAHARVLALDPRGQGRSESAREGYHHARRAADIGELLTAARCLDPPFVPVVLVGWSLGVLESLQYLHDARRAGAATPVRALVLVDNSVGVGDPPAGDPTFFARLRGKRRETVSGFVASMFKRPTDPRWREALVEAALRTPLQASIDLLRQPRPREFWRDALYATTLPVLYATTPKFARQAEIVKAHRPAIETRLFADAGHALFVDEAAAFNDMLAQFVGRTAGGPAATGTLERAAARSAGAASAGAGR